jgi:hypothetical protein
VLSDSSQAETMIAAGRRRAEEFTWEATARRVWSIHVELRRKPSLRVPS